MKILVLILIILVLLTVTGYLAFNYEVNKSQHNLSVPFTISQYEKTSQVASLLVTKKVISNQYEFLLYIKLTGLDKKIEAGSYIIPADISIRNLVKVFFNGRNDVIVTIPSGDRIEEIGNIIMTEMEKKNSASPFSYSEFVKLCNSPSSFNYPFITADTKSLEGFLYPDTYSFSVTQSTTGVINTILKEFTSQIYTSEVKFTNGKYLNFYQDMILSSMLEREAVTNYDKKMIADILIRRMGIGMPLGIDSTVQYALGYSDIEKTWWRQTLYVSDLNIHSPYNTRLFTGLPPTPISNFTTSTFIDSINPITNDYLYYLSDSNGTIHYASTLNGQNLNITKYNVN